MKHCMNIAAALLLTLAALWGCDDEAPAGPGRLLVPGAGQLYHGVFPGTLSGWEDDIRPEDVDAYEAAVGRRVAWVYFSNNWFNGRAFPTGTVRWIRARGAVPFIRLMIRSDVDGVTGPDPQYPLSAILAGAFDEDLRRWGEGAAASEGPLIVEWGTEVNGEWFSWNGLHNGGPGVGPERFKAAYRHIVEQVERAGAGDRITWVFHVNFISSPEEDWNHFERYYPGDDVIDWVGLSYYGSLTPADDWWIPLEARMDGLVSRLAAMAPTRPIMVFELGVTDGNPMGSATEWADAALRDLLGGRWPQIKGLCWWNERWPNGDDPRDATEMRVTEVPGLAEVFHRRLSEAENLVDRPLLGR